MIDAKYAPNGSLRMYEHHIAYHSINDKNFDTARKIERPQRYKKSFPTEIKNINPAIQKFFWLDKYCPEVLRAPYDEHNNLNFSNLRTAQDKQIQVGNKLVPPSSIKALRFGR